MPDQSARLEAVTRWADTLEHVLLLVVHQHPEIDRQVRNMLEDHFQTRELSEAKRKVLEWGPATYGGPDA